MAVGNLAKLLVILVLNGAALSQSEGAWRLASQADGQFAGDYATVEFGSCRLDLAGSG